MVIRMFANFWNKLAIFNGKSKFRTEREAEKFIRDLSKNSTGPNEKLMQMRREYESVKKAKSTAS